MYVVTMIAIAEGFNMLAKMGLDLEIMQKITETSSSGCFIAKNLSPVPGLVKGAPASNNHQGGFAGTHMLKDVLLVKSASEKGGTTVPTADKVEAILRSIIDKGHGDKDFSILYEDLAGRLN